MSYQVISRKWRPTRFEDVIGQEHVTRVLRNALEQDRLGHAYIFSGPRGTGKTTTARLLAKRVNCLNPVDNNPCNTCVNCLETSESRNMDVLEIDGASNRGIDEIRNLREMIKYPPTRGNYRIYIIDEFHQITKDGLNALLKTLEEPPPHALFIFATTELSKVLPTILSRCQRFEFRRISQKDITARLRLICDEEKIGIEEGALQLIARHGDGSMRDAQSFLEQVIGLSDDMITRDSVAELLGLIRDEYHVRILRALAAGDAVSLMQVVDEISISGYEMLEFMNGFAAFVRDLYVIRSSGEQNRTESVENTAAAAADLLEGFSSGRLIQILSLCGEHIYNAARSSSPRLVTESFFLKLLHLDDTLDLRRVIENGDVREASGDERKPPVRTAPVREDQAPPPSAVKQNSPADDTPAGRPMKPFAAMRKETATVPSAPVKTPAAPPAALPETSDNVPAESDRDADDDAEDDQNDSVFTESGDIETVRSLWTQVVGKAGEKNQALHGLLPQAHPHILKDGSLLVLRYAPDFGMDLLKKAKADIENAIQEVCGMSLKLQLEKVKLTAEEQKKRKAQEIDDTTQMLLQAFDGEII